MDYNKYEMITDDERSQIMLNKSMLYADAFVNKNYLINLDKYPVVPIDDIYKSYNNIRLYKFERIVYDVDEISNDKLISVYNALSNIGSTGLLVIKSSPACVEFYLGIYSLDNAPTAGKILLKSLKGNFPGSKITNVRNSDVESVFLDLASADEYGIGKNIASVSIVPSERDSDKNNFVQGIEKFIDSMQGETYTAMIVSKPLNKEVLEMRKRGLQKLYANMSSFAKIDMSYGENSSSAISSSMSKNLSESINDSLTDTTSNFESNARSTAYSKNKGFNFGFLGMGFSRGSSVSNSQSYSSGNSWAKAITSGKTQTQGETTTDGTTKTTGNSYTMSVTYENKAVQEVMEKIDEHLERIKECEAFGLWDTAGYFMSEDIQTAVVAANTYKALMAGNSSSVENSFVNIWSNDDSETTNKILEYMQYGVHPQIMIPSDDSGFVIDDQVVTPASMISGNEIPIIMGLPRKSIPGVSVLNMAEFGRNVYSRRENENTRKINLGYVYHMGEKEESRVRLELESFRSHCFITGSTGSGKSNTTYKILDEMIDKGIPFLVIEPAKGEYKRYYGKLPGINVFCTNPKFYSMLKINPFKFNREIHVLEHLDRLIEIISACWPLYAAMPAILKKSFELAYIRSGWDLNHSLYIPNGHSKYPTFVDILEILPEVINSSEYSSESKGNYIGSLVTRVESLTNGILGQIMCNDSDIDDSVLFDENTIVDLSRISSLETKSLIMGIMIMKLNEYRMGSGQENVPLKHVTVMEEAHNILKRTSGPTSADSADVQGKSVEMISSSIAEMRTFGEGFIIVDQSPTAVDVSAIKNTNTKIIMRLPDYDDCNIAGKAIGLTESQINELSKLPMGVAAVYQNNWVEAVLTQIDKSEEIYHNEDVICTQSEIAEVKGTLVEMLVECYESGKFDSFDFELEDFIDVINESDISKYKKTELITKVIDFTEYYSTNIATEINFAMNLDKFIGCEGLFKIFDIKLQKKYRYEPGVALLRKDITMSVVKEAKKWKNVVLKNFDEYAVINNYVTKDNVLKYLMKYRCTLYPKWNKYHVYLKCLY